MGIFYLLQLMWFETANVVPEIVDAEAVLGIAPKPSITITQAFDIYCEKIELAEMLGKSESQKRDWRKIKYRSVLNFVDLHGDMSMDKITRKYHIDPSHIT